MSAFTLDTSGAVWGERPDEDGMYRWTDLDPLTQGYVEALLRELAAKRWAAYRASCTVSPGRHLPVPIDAAYCWLAPEALAMIMGDCAAWRRRYPRTTSGGAGFWRIRQEALVPRAEFPPLTVSLGDDGRVKLSLRDGGSTSATKADSGRTPS